MPVYIWIPIVVVLAFAGIVWGMSAIPFWERSEYLEAETTEYGIVIHGHDVPGWIENGNDFPVRIRSTWTFHGESNRWNRVLLPGEWITDTPGYQVLYHVYLTNSSEEIGVIQTSANGPKGPQYRNPFISKRHTAAGRI
jgi:hypothetical protein